MDTAGHIETCIAGPMPVVPVRRPVQYTQATVTEKA